MSKFFAMRWLIGIHFIGMCMYSMSSPFWPIYLQTISKLNSTNIPLLSGLIYAGPLVMAIIFTPIWGRLSDRIGHKLMLVRSIVALGITQLIISFSDNISVILVARISQGIFAGIFAASMAYAVNISKENKSINAIAKLQIASELGYIIGPMLGGVIMEHFGFLFVTGFSAIICFFCGFLALKKLPETNDKLKNKKQKIINDDIYLNKNMRRLLFSIILMQSGEYACQPFFAFYANSVLHFSPSGIGIAYGSASIGICIAAPIFAKFFEKKCTSLILRQLMFCSILCSLITAFSIVNTSQVLFILSRVFWGLFMAGLLPGLIGLISKMSPENQQGLAIGYGHSACKAGALLGISIGSLAFMALSIKYSFIVVSFIYIASAIQLFLLQRNFLLIEGHSKN